MGGPASSMIPDPSILDTLAAELTPSQTLLYIPNWRQSSYDTNYPDYTPAPGAQSFVAKAHTLGFKVMLHTNLIGVAPGNPDYASVQRWQVRDPGTLQLMGWDWSSPASTPNRFANIDPASSVYRQLFIAHVGAAVAALQPDALHLDTSSFTFNDGNGPIEGMNYAQGVVQLHKDILATFPNLALGGEGMNDTIYAYNSFAQNSWTGDDTLLLGHPIAGFLWNSQTNGQTQIQYYGHLSEPRATDPNFVGFVALVERQGILPVLSVNGPSDLDLTNADNARLLHWLESWQANGFQPAWSTDWTGSLIHYQGVSGAAATLTDSGSVISLNAGGSTLYQRVHDSTQQDATGYIANWPAFDATWLYGLDPAEQYWLDAVPRPATTHITDLPSGVQVGTDTMISPGFAYFDLAAAQPFSFFNSLWDAQIGITYKGTDGPLADGAMVQILTTTAGGVARQGIFMPPPGASATGGETFVEWPVPLSGTSAFLFSVGVDDSAGTCTDGVTFRVVVHGAEAWRQNVLHQGWVDGSVDLSAYAGTTVQLRIVTDPGPANNPNCDWASFSNLALASLDNVTTSVPLALGPSNTVSSFARGGTFSATGPGAGTVFGVPVPGQFVLFFAPGTPVNAGTSLAGLPFTTWLGGEGQLPVPATSFNSNLSYLATGSVSSATSNGVTRQNAIFALPPNEGRTILAWTLALPSRGNLQLGWSSGMGDGCPSNTGVQFSARIDGVTYWTLFQQTPVGWSPGALDLTNWSGQTILLQLVTDSVGDNSCDWAWWADLAISGSAAGCSVTVSPGGQAFQASGGTGTISVTTDSGCPWTASGAPRWVTFNGVYSGAGNSSVGYSVAANSEVARSGIITVAGQSFVVEQESSSVAALSLAGSMAQLASGAGWDTTLTLVNTGGTTGEALLNFFGNDGSPLQLPFSFSQLASPAGPLLASTLDQRLNANSLLVLDTQQLSNPNAQVGSAQVFTEGNIGGFAIFKIISTGQQAVVPLEARNAPSYLLAFDSTNALQTGFALANLSAAKANVNIVVRDDAGAAIPTKVTSIPLDSNGHASFMLNDATQGFPEIAGKRGTVEFDTPAGGQIGLLGIRVNGKAITTLPVLAQVGTTGGALAHVATGGGWETGFTIVNTGTSAAQFTLSFYDEKTGVALPLALAFPQTAATQTTASLTQTLAPGATLLIQTQGGSSPVTCSARLATTGQVSGFAIFQYVPSAQEAVVPLETRTPAAYVLAYDNTNGLATGVALANMSAQAASVPVVVRDETGATLTQSQIQLAGNGHASFMLTDATQGFPATADMRGTIEFDVPAGGRISALGIRAVASTHVITTIPVLAKQ
jgi:hypothetical protein